jgi:cyclic-di-AMP phosphodiesterase
VDRGEKMKKQYKIKLLIYAFVCLLLMGAVIINLSKDYSLAKLVLAILLLVFMTSQFLSSYHAYYRDSNKINVDELSYHIKKVGADTFNNFPVVTLVYNDKYKIEWANYYSKQVIDKRMINKHLSDIDMTLYEKLSLKHYMVEIKGRIYEVNHNIELRTLYLVDVSKREQHIRLLEDKKLAIGYLVLDNLAESISDFTDQKRYMFMGRINSTIMDYAKEQGLFLKTYGEGKYLILVEHMVLNQMIQNKFDILSKIRKVSDLFETTLTISIGIAANQESLIGLNDKAMEALELTQSRGGDQVALMLGDKNVKFFGGKSNIIEKRNRVRARVVARELDELIEGADQVIIMGHKIPDTDAFGACMGILNIVSRRDREGYIVLDSKEIDNTLGKVITYLQENNSTVLNKVVSPQVAMDLITSKSLLVVVDTQNPNLVIEPKVLQKAKKVVVIDHHRRGTQFIESPTLIYTEMYASSSVELISEIIEYYPTKLQINDLDATIMLAGMIVDTNNFTYRTGSRTFEAASFLRKQGADTLAVQTMLRESYQEHLIRAILFEKVEITHDHMAIVVADNIDNLTNVKLAQTADWLLMIENVKASFVIGKLDANTVGVSSRSFGEVNVQLIMEKMQGGGHFNNAATQLKDITLQHAYELLTESIKEYLKELENDESNSIN